MKLKSGLLTLLGVLLAAPVGFYGHARLTRRRFRRKRAMSSITPPPSTT